MNLFKWFKRPEPSALQRLEKLHRDGVPGLENAIAELRARVR